MELRLFFHRYMGPSDAVDSVTNSHISDAELFGKDAIADLVRNVSTPELPNIIFRQGLVVATAIQRVMDVVKRRAGVQMPRVHALGIVAMMTRVHPIGHIDPSKVQRKPVCTDHPTPISNANGEHAVPLIDRPRPRPASIRAAALVNVGPESGFDIGSCECLTTRRGAVPKRFDARRLHIEVRSTMTTSDIWGTMVLHFWSLLRRFRGAMPRVATNNAGAFAYPHYTRNPHNQAKILPKERD